MSWVYENDSVTVDPFTSQKLDLFNLLKLKSVFENFNKYMTIKSQMHEDRVNLSSLTLLSRVDHK